MFPENHVVFASISSSLLIFPSLFVYLFVFCCPLLHVSSEALVRKDYKYMYWPDYKYEQLFDLVNDPGEMEDIFNSTDPAIAEIRAVMKKRFEELRNLVRSDEIVTL